MHLQDFSGVSQEGVARVLSAQPTQPPADGTPHSGYGGFHGSTYHQDPDQLFQEGLPSRGSSWWVPEVHEMAPTSEVSALDDGKRNENEIFKQQGTLTCIPLSHGPCICH